MISVKWLIIFIIALLCSYKGVVGVKGIRSISPEEEEKNDDLELERQLKILNKTPIKTFQIGKGQTIDCVDIYNQPAFDHPLLKNHKIQLRPSHISPSPHRPLQKVVDCPEGTVPIRRTSKDDLIRAKSFAESYPDNAAAANTSTYHQNVVGSVGKPHIAVMGTPITQKKYYGISGSLNSQNPIVDRDQSSSSRLWIENVQSSDTLDTLQIGWIVSPQLYSDYATHLFGYWKHEEHSSSDGCYDTFCTGFVQVNRQYFFGMLLERTSFYGDSQKLAVDVSIYQDDRTGNWLAMSGSIYIGYWPKVLVPSLSEGALTVSWGGAVQESLTSGQSPKMGNGYFPAGMGNWNYGCFISDMKVFNQHQYWEQGVEVTLEKYADKEQCYRIEYYGWIDPNYGYALQFGGPGGDCR